MITSISVADVATFGNSPEELNDLAMFNFVFGANGTGKTTISRLLADPGKFPTCQVRWRGGVRLESLVYNRDFVERNFAQSTELPGVFTLGEKQVDALARIAAANKEIEELARKSLGLSRTLEGEDDVEGGKKAELKALEERFKKQCWSQKQKYDGVFRDAFAGVRGKSIDFKNRVLEESASNNEELFSVKDLEERTASIFGAEISKEQPIHRINSSGIIAYESEPILGRPVVGKEDVDIAGMITKLGNNDWVRQGRSFYDDNNRICPFCQQQTTEAFEQSLNEYFDESFEADKARIRTLAEAYKEAAGQILEELEALVEVPSKFLEVERLKDQIELLKSRITINCQQLADKEREPSRVVKLEPLGELIEPIQKLIDSANDKVRENNRILDNLATERGRLKRQIWRFVLEELKREIEEYKNKRSSLDKAISSIEQQIEETRAAQKVKKKEVRQLEKQTTSVQPTVDSINGLLRSFGFRAFSLARASSGTSYKLVRSDGSDALETLSEGEKTFVTFLYFYFLLKGSVSESGMTTDRIVVFDDPVSSLDSDILFIVSSLIKELFDQVRLAEGHIKQIFILTHNVYFHKEVSFNTKRHDVAMNEETFWIVRKPNLRSRVEKQVYNPIQTSYELLWSEIRNSGNRSNLTIQNTMRRIIENYFKILGGIDTEIICARFRDQDRLICKSLARIDHQPDDHRGNPGTNGVNKAVFALIAGTTTRLHP